MYEYMINDGTQLETELISQMQLLRRDPNLAGFRYVDATPEETEAEKHAIEMANDMLDDCIAIVREVLKPMKDLISREAAIEKLKKVSTEACNRLNHDQNSHLVRYMKALNKSYDSRRWADKNDKETKKTKEETTDSK